MRPLLQIKLPREPRGGVTAASGTVICPPRAARVYTVYTGEGRALSLSLSLSGVWWKTVVEPDARRPGYRIYGCRATTTLRSLQEVINLASR